MNKVHVGQKATISCQGLTVTGTVVSADHEYRYTPNGPEVIGYLIEIRNQEDGLIHYWKSLIDGGSLIIHPELEVRTIEVRIRTRPTTSR